MSKLWASFSLPLGLLSLLVALFFRLDGDVETFIRERFHPNRGFYQDKVVWITGASSGIGESYAGEVSRNGATVVLSARREDELRRVQQSLGEAGVARSLVLPFDMTNTSAHTAATQAVLATYGRIDVLVLNAGAMQRSVVWETPMSTIRSLMELNFFSVVSLTQAVLPHMLERGAGQLVITSSFTGRVATPLSSTYAATKYALHGMFDSLRAEVGDRGVKVTMVCPGPVRSHLISNSIDHQDPQGAPPPMTPPAATMPTERCAALMASGVANGQYELWITNQPLLAVFYASVYSQRIFTWHMSILGPARARVYTKGGDYDDVALLMRETLSPRN